MRGRFITVEGIEGTGKSTNIQFIVELLEGRGVEVLHTREPGGTPMAEKIRELLLDHGQESLPPVAELLLFFAARSLHIENAIRPALARGTWVVCDRFTDASRAYQGSGRGLDADAIEQLADWIQAGLEPDLTILLDAPASVGMRRVRERGNGDRMDNEDAEFFERVRERYLALAERFDSRFTVIDASCTLDDVQASIRERVDALFADK